MTSAGQCSQCSEPALIIADPATGMEYRCHYCHGCAEANGARIDFGSPLRGNVPPPRTHHPAAPHPAVVVPLAPPSLEDLFRKHVEADEPPTASDHHVFPPAPPPQTRGPRRINQRRVRGGAVMVTMARAKPCPTCQEPNDSDVTRSPNGMFQHYVECSACRDGGEVREALKHPGGTRTPSQPRKRGQPLRPHNPDEFKRRMKRQHNVRTYGKEVKHPTVLFGLDEPGVEYFEVPAPEQDWRVAMKATTDENPTD